MERPSYSDFAMKPGTTRSMRAGELREGVTRLPTGLGRRKPEGRTVSGWGSRPVAVASDDS